MPTESWEFEQRAEDRSPDASEAGPDDAPTGSDGATSTDGAPSGPVASEDDTSVLNDATDVLPQASGSGALAGPVASVTSTIPAGSTFPGRQPLPSAAPGTVTSALPAGATLGADASGRSEPSAGAPADGSLLAGGSPGRFGTGSEAGSGPASVPPSGPLVASSPGPGGLPAPPAPVGPGGSPSAPPPAGGSRPSEPAAPSGFAAPGQAAPQGTAAPSPPLGTGGYVPTSAPGRHGASATAAPVSPPLHYRPDVPRRDGPPPAQPAPVPAADPSSSAPERVTPASGWGWRALLAFLAGGVLAAAGFAVAQLGDDDSTAAQDPVPTTVTTDTTLPEDGTDTTALEDPAPVDEATEPAALVAEVLGPSVVLIETDFGIGSGVVYDDGLIITNHHVVADAQTLRVVLNDGSSVEGRLLGSSSDVDVAVVAVDDDVELPPATLALGEKPTVGQTAVAIGSPFRLQQSVTEGIVSAVDRPVPSGASIVAMIQTDAPINPGNSGGALADREGRVIGINTAIQTGGTSNTNAGVGFAIPIDTAVGVADKIVAGEPIEPGFLGVRGESPADFSAGVEITEVTPGSAAEDAGVRVGDHVLSVDGAPVTAFEDLIGLIVAHSPGDEVELEIVRDGQPLTVTATLGRRDG